ncbi:proline--tRNA ligase [Candidatus Uhrbacteria bacterium]|nr:proline--tRNA ligase [Candidatus Uhrbacteria bacterium]
MFQSTLLGKTSKHSPRDAESISHILLTRSGYIQQLMSGVYSLLPMGFRVHKNIENIIREELNILGCQELLMPSLQPANLWMESNRWDTIDPPLFKFEDRHKKIIGLASTHEEVITDLARTHVHSYRDLPFSAYQIQTKFRNEMRSTSGLLRVREFIMKDLYSFHRTEEDLDIFYEAIKAAYARIYQRCGIRAVPIRASSGSIGGNFSHEFACIAPTGEDKIALCSSCDFAANFETMEQGQTVCPQCGAVLTTESAIENGHIFKLGTKYSEPLHATFVNEDGIKKPIIMGCYGIGVGRLLATVIETNHDENGMIWPVAIAPFAAHIIPLTSSDDAIQTRISNEAKKLYETLFSAGIETLFDDRSDATAGEKFKDADLIGLPHRIVISEKTLAQDSGEWKERASKEIKILRLSDIVSLMKS